jgi:SsrA-binding protein
MMMLMVRKSHKEKQGSVAANKKAYRNFELVEKFEAGLALLGTEVKSLRAGGGDLNGSYARIEDEQCWLVGAGIAPYEQAGHRQHEPTRKRKLLLHKAEIRRIRGKLEQRGFTLVPLRIYFNDRTLTTGAWPRRNWRWRGARGNMTRDRRSPHAIRSVMLTEA